MDRAREVIEESTRVDDPNRGRMEEEGGAVCTRFNWGLGSAAAELIPFLLLLLLLLPLDMV